MAAALQFVVACGAAQIGRMQERRPEQVATRESRRSSDKAGIAT
jgi:hypothetical protein